MSGVAGPCDCPLGHAHSPSCPNYIEVKGGRACTCATPWVASHSASCPLYRYSVGESHAVALCGNRGSDE